MQDVIRNALRDHSFQVYYQPIWNAKSASIDSAEALLRLKDEEWKKCHAVGSVEELVRAAEESGLIAEVGRFVLEEVCRFIAKELPGELGIRYIEVNLSVAQCEKEDLIDMVKNVMEHFGVRPEQIRFEITESAPVHNLSVMQKNLQMLNEFGSEFLLDDYGSGYANLSYLMNFPTETVKLDKNLLWEAEKSEKAAMILQGTIEMLQKTGYQIVAEGVETPDQKKRLTDLHCEYLQGYYFSKPLSGKEFITYCRAHKLKKVST